MNKVLTALSYMIVLALVGAVMAGGYAVWRVVETTVSAIPAWMYLAAGAGVLFAAVVVVVGGAMAIVQRMARSNRRIYARDGLYPVLDHGHGHYVNVNEPGAQSLAVLASGRRPTAALAGRVIDGQWRNVNTSENLPALPEPAQALTVQDVVDVDPREHPHWLIVGSTGSGKTVASYAVLGELARRAACQFVITEPGGVNWGTQCTATNTRDIAGAILDVQRELERRQQLLRAEDVDHVQDLRQPLPYVVLVAEETETVLDDLRLEDKDTRLACILALRSIARLGRKAGICLVAVTQSGSVDVFDAHVRRNLSNVLLFRSQHTVGETWRVSRDVRLAELPTGAAWSVRHSSVVSFPRMARPALPSVAVERTEAAYNGADDGIPVQWPVYRPETALQPGIPVFSTDTRTAYSPAQVAHIQARYAALGSIKAVERELYQQDGGYWFYRLKEVLP